MDKLRYPIGRYSFEGMTVKQREQWILEIERLPGQLRAALADLDEDMLNTVFHCASVYKCSNTFYIL